MGSLLRDLPVLFAIDGLTVQQVPFLKILGITINRILKWDHHVLSVCSKANSRVFHKEIKEGGNHAGRTGQIFHQRYSSSYRVCLFHWTHWSDQTAESEYWISSASGRGHYLWITAFCALYWYLFPNWNPLLSKTGRPSITGPRRMHFLISVPYRLQLNSVNRAWPSNSSNDRCAR